MLSSMTSQGGLKVGPLYSYMNEIVTFFMITKQRAKISSLNFLRIWPLILQYDVVCAYFALIMQLCGICYIMSDMQCFAHW